MHSVIPLVIVRDIYPREPVGAFELQQATKNLQFLQDKLKLKSPVHQVHTTVNRMFSDLEFRGSVRPITEEFNLTRD